MKEISKLQNKNIVELSQRDPSRKFLGKYQKGITLIEAMVSLLIFSVGALGLAAMQLTALAASGDNQQRTVAIWKAQDLADRIRSNPNLRATYVNQIGNPNIATIGVDSVANVVGCGANQYAPPPAICSDVPGGGTANNCTDVQQVAYDVWEVFCEPSTGAAVVSAGGAAVAAGSVGLTNLEVALIDNQVGGVAGPNGNDMLLYFEWVSREADANATGNTNDNIGVNVQQLNTDLCGTNVPVAATLDTYCLRFNPF